MVQETTSVIFSFRLLFLFGVYKSGCTGHTRFCLCWHLDPAIWVAAGQEVSHDVRVFHSAQFFTEHIQFAWRSSEPVILFLPAAFFSALSLSLSLFLEACYVFKGSLVYETSVLRTFKNCSYTTHQYTTHHTPLIIHHSSYTTHHTPLIIHHSSYTTHHTPLIILHSSYTTLHTQVINTPLINTPLIIHHSSYTTHHTPLIIHHSSCTTRHTPLIIHHSSYTTHHTPLIIHHSSYTTHHAPLITHHSSYTTRHAPLVIHHSSSS